MEKMTFELNDELKHAFDTMEKTPKNVLITGKAGTGKSTFLHYFMRNTNKEVIVLAPTGLAAINVNGQTIHSFFKFPPKLLDSSDIRHSRSPIYRRIDAIIIDEVSMVRADMFDAIDQFMRLNGRESNKPFGGVQLMLIGDLYQLPPVVDNGMAKVMESLYQSPYFFDSKVMKQLDLEIVELTKVYRQKDAHFIEFLDSVRLGCADSIKLEIINGKVSNQKPDETMITITPTNRIATEINTRELAKLPGESCKFKAELEGDFKVNESNVPVDLELHLKEDARVIFVKNDPAGRWVNGTLGIVQTLGEDYVKVKLYEDNAIVTVKKMDWERVRYEYDRENNRILADVVGKLTQIPLRLAWALTIHKCQGQTLDRVYLDLTSGVWEYGQTYVALSRCKTLEGISLKCKIWPNDIKVDSRISEFLNKKVK